SQSPLTSSDFGQSGRQPRRKSKPVGRGSRRAVLKFDVQCSMLDVQCFLVPLCVFVVQSAICTPPSALKWLDLELGSDQLIWACRRRRPKQNPAVRSQKP